MTAFILMYLFLLTTNMFIDGNVIKLHVHLYKLDLMFNFDVHIKNGDCVFLMYICPNDIYFKKYCIQH